MKMKCVTFQVSINSSGLVEVLYHFQAGSSYQNSLCITAPEGSFLVGQEYIIHVAPVQDRDVERKDNYEG